MAVVFYKGCGKTVSRDQQETWNKDARSGCEIYTRGCGRVSGENEEGVGGEGNRRVLGKTEGGEREDREREGEGGRGQR